MKNSNIFSLAIPFLSIFAGCAAAPGSSETEADTLDDEISTARVNAIDVVRTPAPFVPGGIVPSGCVPNTFSLSLSFVTQQLSGNYCSTQGKIVPVNRVVNANRMTEARAALRAVRVAKKGTVSQDAGMTTLDVREGATIKKYGEVVNLGLGRTAAKNVAALGDVVFDIAVPVPATCLAVPTCEADEQVIDPNACLTATGIQCTTRTRCGRSITCAKATGGI